MNVDDDDDLLVDPMRELISMGQFVGRIVTVASPPPFLVVEQTCPVCDCPLRTLVADVAASVTVRWLRQNTFAIFDEHRCQIDCTSRVQLLRLRANAERELERRGRVAKHVQELATYTHLPTRYFTRAEHELLLIGEAYTRLEALTR